MVQRHVTASLLASAVLATACPSTQLVSVDGRSVEKRSWERAVRLLTPRSAFELKCPAGQLRFSLLRAVYHRPDEIGVEGCSQRLVFVSYYDGFLLNSASGLSQ